MGIFCQCLVDVLSTFRLHFVDVLSPFRGRFVYVLWTFSGCLIRRGVSRSAASPQHRRRRRRRRHGLGGETRPSLPPAAPECEERGEPPQALPVTGPRSALTTQASHHTSLWSYWPPQALPVTGPRSALTTQASHHKSLWSYWLPQALPVAGPHSALTTQASHHTSLWAYWITGPLCFTSNSINKWILIVNIINIYVYIFILYIDDCIAHISTIVMKQY